MIKLEKAYVNKVTLGMHLGKAMGIKMNDNQRFIYFNADIIKYTVSEILCSMTEKMISIVML